MSRCRSMGAVMLVLAVTACLGTVSVASAQTRGLPATPELPPPEAPPTPAPVLPSSPAPSVATPPPAPSRVVPTPATPTTQSAGGGPAAAQRADARRAARSRRAAAAKRRLEAVAARRRVSGATRAAASALTRSVTRPAGRVSPPPAGAPPRDDRIPLAAGVVLAAALAALVAFLVRRRRRTRRSRAPGPRRPTTRIQHLVITFGTTVAILGLNVVTGVIIARGLGPDGRGELTAISGLPQTLGWLFAFGSVQAISYHQARRPGDAARLIGTWLSVLVPVGVIAFVCGELLVPVFLSAQTPDTIALGHAFLVLTFVGVLTNVSLGMILGDGDFGFYNLTKLLQTLVTAIGFVVLWQLDALTVTSALVVIGAVMVAAFVVLSARVLRRHPIGRPDRTLIRSTAWFGLRAHGSDLGGIGTVRLDLTIIPAFLGASLVGYYAVAASVAGVFITLSGSVAGVLLSMAARDQEEGPRIVLRATAALIAVCGAIAAVVWILAPQAVELVYGHEFLASVTPLRILLPGAVLFGAASIIGQGLNALNRPFTAAVGQLIGLVITVAGLVIFLPVGGIEAAAITSLVAYTSVFAIGLLLYLRELRRGPARSVRRGSPTPLFTRVVSHDAARAVALVAAVVLGSATAGWLLTRPGDARLAIVGVTLAALAGLGAMSVRLLAPALMVWLAALGLVRRLLTELVEPTAFDLLLLVGPSVVIVLLIGSRSLHGPIRKSTLTGLVATLAVLTVAAALNPLNDSPVAGLAGLLFVLIPLLAYWIGMRIDATTLKQCLYIVGGLSVITAGYGLYQAFGGFPAWDRHWITTSGYDALNVGGEIRPFSSFSSASEYAAYTGIGLTLALAFLFRRARFLPAMLPFVALLGTALFVESSRGVVFKLVAAIGLMFAASRGMRLATSVAVALALVLLLPVVVSKVAPQTSSNPLVAHQVGGLGDPTNAKTSTLSIHASLITDALRQSVTTPVGSGLSTVTIASGRLGGGRTEAGGGVAAAETDIETAAVAMGLPGLIVFLAIFGLGIARLFTLARDEPGFLPLAGLGILTVTSLQWLNGGQYAVGILPWLVLGWAEARHLARRDEARALRASREREEPWPMLREPVSTR